jgi:hypothetical protein
VLDDALVQLLPPFVALRELVLLLDVARIDAGCALGTKDLALA